MFVPYNRDTDDQNGGTLEVLFCFVFFYLVFAGAGPWSLDVMWRKKT